MEPPHNKNTCSDYYHQVQDTKGAHLQLFAEITVNGSNQNAHHS